MAKIKKKIVKLEHVESLGALQFQICGKLKLKGWQFDNLPLEEKLLKWASRHPDKELVFEIDKELVHKHVRQHITRLVLTERSTFPPNYEMGNPHNRWIHNDPIIRTQEEVNEDDEKIARTTEEEFANILSQLASIKNICTISFIA